MYMRGLISQSLDNVGLHLGSALSRRSRRSTWSLQLGWSLSASGLVNRRRRGRICGGRVPRCRRAPKEAQTLLVRCYNVKRAHNFFVNKVFIQQARIYRILMKMSDCESCIRKQFHNTILKACPLLASVHVALRIRKTWAII